MSCIFFKPSVLKCSSALNRTEYTISVNVTYLQMCSLHAEYFPSVLLSVQVSLHNKRYLCVFRFQSPLLYFTVFLPITLYFMAYLAYLSSVFLSHFSSIYIKGQSLYRQQLKTDISKVIIAIKSWVWISKEIVYFFLIVFLWIIFIY